MPGVALADERAKRRLIDGELGPRRAGGGVELVEARGHRDLSG